MVKSCGAQNMFQGDVFTIAGWIPGSSTMTGIDEVRPNTGQKGQIGSNAGQKGQTLAIRVT